MQVFQRPKEQTVTQNHCKEWGQLLTDSDGIPFYYVEMKSKRINTSTVNSLQNPDVVIQAGTKEFHLHSEVLSLYAPKLLSNVTSAEICWKDRRQKEDIAPAVEIFFKFMYPEHKLPMFQDGKKQPIVISVKKFII